VVNTRLQWASAAIFSLMYERILTAVVLFLSIPIGVAAEDSHAAADELGDRVIGEVVINNGNIFDLSDPEQNTWLYRTINRLHITTRKGTIEDQLLFRPGERFERSAVKESERILRRNKYLYDANIEVQPVGEDKVDLQVNTSDIWSLLPELGYSRKGGRTRTRLGLEEKNLLGRGQQLRFLRDNEIERSENLIQFADRNLGRTWVSLVASYSDNSDGFSHGLSVTRPFYSLDARWAAGANASIEDKRSKFYQFAEEAAEYRHERNYALGFGGWSAGLQGGKTRRWTAGFVYDDNRFSAVPDSELPSLVPENRKLVYPYLGFELVEDEFVTAQNHDQIDRTEDFQMGARLHASLGWAATALGSDRDAALFGAGASRGFGSMEKSALFLSARARGRYESGSLANAALSFGARLYLRQSPKRTFYLGANGTFGEALDLDKLVEIGGRSGMRGYPYRYQVGESRFLATIEQRYFTDWQLWRIGRIGAAVFADVGRVWGDNPVGADNRGWLVDVGFGLRLALARVAAGRMIHIDLAFPMNGDPAIDNVQLLLEARRSF
jgi:hemolysin activation/secretion protein